jgi:hypothetical protein
MTIFKDKHVKYVNRCGEGHHLSVWECYTETARQCILQHLQAISSHPEEITSQSLADLSDNDLYSLLQNELGISYDVDVENALKTIHFEGSILDISNWVVFHTAWSQVLKRVTPSGTVQPRRLAELFRSSIPDDFMQSWLHARKHPTWTEAYSAAITALKDTKWQTCYSKHIIAKASPRAPVPDKPKHINAAAFVPTPQPSKPPSTKDLGSVPTHPTGHGQYKPFDPLKFRTRKGALNVNPNLKGVDYWEHDKSLCSRCGILHRWNPDVCTADKDAAGADILPKLTPQDLAIRLKKRWDRGFFFSKPIADYKSPSAQDAAQTAASVSTKLQKNSDGKNSS